MNHSAEDCRKSPNCEIGIVKFDIEHPTSPISKGFDKHVGIQRGVNGHHAQNRILGRFSGKWNIGERSKTESIRSSISRSESRHLNDKSDCRCDEGKKCCNRSKNHERNNCEINEDWGRRTELLNIFHVRDGDKVWNIIRRGLFAEIKLWRNGYGSINCKATGKISIKGIPEKSLIEINTEEILRKLLNLSQSQWSALCEAVDQLNVTLSFNAFEEVDLNKMNSLDKLWYFICKRRHFLPNVCVMGKLSGAVKLMKELLIMPKIVIIQIRDFKGEEIC